METNNKILEAKKQVLELILQNPNQNFDLNDLYLQTDNLEENLNQIEDLKKGLDSFKPLEGPHIEKLNKYLDEIYICDSNTIEGNTLTLKETSRIINHGIAIGGKSIREHLEVINHVEAIKYINNIVQNKEPLSHKVLLHIHHLILNSIIPEYAGRYRNVNVKIVGSQYITPRYEKVYDLMEEYFDFYEQNKSTMSPIILSAYMHEKLVTIHPFVDGNGRTSRLIMNLILLSNGYPITNISSEKEEKIKYYDALEKVQIKEDENAFLLFIAQKIKESLINYLEIIAMNGDSSLKGEYFYNRYLKLKKDKNNI